MAQPGEILEDELLALLGLAKDPADPRAECVQRFATHKMPSMPASSSRLHHDQNSPADLDDSLAPCPRASASKLPSNIPPSAQGPWLRPDALPAPPQTEVALKSSCEALGGGKADEAEAKTPLSQAATPKCIEVRLETCVDMCVDMCVDTCLDMRVDMCADMRGRCRSPYKHTLLLHGVARKTRQACTGCIQGWNAASLDAGAHGPFVLG